MIIILFLYPFNVGICFGRLMKYLGCLVNPSIHFSFPFFLSAVVIDYQFVRRRLVFFFIVSVLIFHIFKFEYSVLISSVRWVCFWFVVLFSSTIFKYGYVVCHCRLFCHYICDTYQDILSVFYSFNITFYVLEITLYIIEY